MAAIMLYQFPGEGGLSVSPYCNKVHWALRLKGLVYRTEDVVRPRRVSATGQLPVLVYDGTKVHDSTAILRWLEAHHPTPALVPAAPVEAAHAHILEEWADETLTAFRSYYRVLDPAGFRAYAARGVGTLPPVIARLGLRASRRRAQARLRSFARRGPDAIREDFERQLDALAALLANSPWLVGGAPSIADIAVAAQLQPLTLGDTPEAHAWLRARSEVDAWLARFLAATRTVPFRDD